MSGELFSFDDEEAQTWRWVAFCFVALFLLLLVFALFVIWLVTR